jgi:hypothetical protein
MAATPPCSRLLFPACVLAKHSHRNGDQDGRPGHSSNQDDLTLDNILYADLRIKPDIHFISTCLYDDPDAGSLNQASRLYFTLDNTLYAGLTLKIPLRS